MGIEETPDRGYLHEEPCQFCHKVGGVWFLIDDSAYGKNASQVVGCDLCGNIWTSDVGVVGGTTASTEAIAKVTLTKPKVVGYIPEKWRSGV